MQLRGLISVFGIAGPRETIFSKMERTIYLLIEFQLEFHSTMHRGKDSLCCNFPEILFIRAVVFRTLLIQKLYKFYRASCISLNRCIDQFLDTSFWLAELVFFIIHSPGRHFTILVSDHIATSIGLLIISRGLHFFYVSQFLFSMLDKCSATYPRRYIAFVHLYNILPFVCNRAKRSRCYCNY